MNAGRGPRETREGTARVTVLAPSVLWPILAGQIVSGCITATALLLGGGTLALALGAAGLAALLGLGLFQWQEVRRQQARHNSATAATTALLLALPGPAALTNAAGLVEANAQWISLVGRTGPEALGLKTPPSGEDQPLSIRGADGKGGCF